MNLLLAEIWKERAKKHAALVGFFADAFVKRRSVGLTHPVHDFLFTYYSFSPAKLKQWVPSLREKIIFTAGFGDEYFWLKDHWFQLEEDILSLNRKLIPGTCAFSCKIHRGTMQEYFTTTSSVRVLWIA